MLGVLLRLSVYVSTTKYYLLVFIIKHVKTWNVTLQECSIETKLCDISKPQRYFQVNYILFQIKFYEFVYLFILLAAAFLQHVKKGNGIVHHL